MCGAHMLGRGGPDSVPTCFVTRLRRVTKQVGTEARAGRTQYHTLKASSPGRMHAQGVQVACTSPTRPARAGQCKYERAGRAVPASMRTPARPRPAAGTRRAARAGGAPGSYVSTSTASVAMPGTGSGGATAARTGAKLRAKRRRCASSTRRSACALAGTQLRTPAAAQSSCAALCQPVRSCPHLSGRKHRMPGTCAPNNQPAGRGGHHLLLL